MGDDSSARWFSKRVAGAVASLFGKKAAKAAGSESLIEEGLSKALARGDAEALSQWLEKMPRGFEVMQAGDFVERSMSSMFKGPRERAVALEALAHARSMEGVFFLAYSQGSWVMASMRPSVANKEVAEDCRRVAQDFACALGSAWARMERSQRWIRASGWEGVPIEESMARESIMRGLVEKVPDMYEMLDRHHVEGGGFMEAHKAGLKAMGKINAIDFIKGRREICGSNFKPSPFVSWLDGWELGQVCAPSAPSKGRAKSL